MPPVRPELEVAALSGEVDAVMQDIVERLMALPHADGASLSSTDGESATFRVCVGEDLPLLGQTYRINETLAGEVLRNRDLVLVREETQLDRSLTDGAGTIALVPLEWDGEVRGVLGVRSADHGAFDADGVEEIRTLAAGASIAIRNAELVERLAESERDLTQRKENEERLRTSLGPSACDRRDPAGNLRARARAGSRHERDRPARPTPRRRRRRNGAVVRRARLGLPPLLGHSRECRVGLRMERSSSLAGVAARAGEPVYSPDTTSRQPRRRRRLHPPRRALADLRAALPRGPHRRRPLGDVARDPTPSTSSRSRPLV